MNLTHRDYVDQDGDFLLISRFIYTHYAQLRRNSTWCIGRFVDWRYGMWGKKPTTPDFWDKNAHLWFDGFGRLAGFAISEEGGCEFAVITTEGYGFLFEELLVHGELGRSRAGAVARNHVPSTQRGGVPRATRICT